MRSTTKATVAKARQLRREMSPPEARLWQILRGRPLGLKFRRQHPIGPYVLDFYCPSLKVGIEVDGQAHDMGSNPARDEGRDAWLQERGLEIIRIPVADLHDPELMIQMILARIGGFSPSTALRAVPLPTGCAGRED
jgi:very-short-patch-repair endonuclease